MKGIGMVRKDHLKKSCINKKMFGVNTGNQLPQITANALAFYLLAMIYKSEAFKFFHLLFVIFHVKANDRTIARFTTLFPLL